MIEEVSKMGVKFLVNTEVISNGARNPGEVRRKL